MENNLRILIAGTTGFVGARALIHYPQAGVVESRLLHESGQALADFVKDYHPDVILNTAAISDIGACAKDPEGSYQSNVILPVVLAGAAEEIGAKLISFSSDQVYTGCEAPGPYGEDLVLPPPANLYARHKLEAEQRVLDIHPDSVLLRATWMYDMPLYGHRNRGNFLVNTLDAALHGKPVAVHGREYRGITYVRQVAENMDGVCRLPGGVYNYGSENPLTMLETAQALLDTLGVDAVVQDTGLDKHNLWMDCSKAAALGVVFDSTQEGFRRCAADYGLAK